MRAVCLSFAIAIVAASPALCQELRPRGPVAPYRLELLSSSGWLDLERPSTLSQRDRDLGAGILGHISDFIVDSNTHELYVLDATQFKIAVFDTTGAFLRLIVGGAGDGPGEFRQPRSLTLLGTDRVAVIDAGSRRISTFEKEGAFLRSFPVATGFPLQIASYDDGFAVVKFVAGRGSLVVRLDSMGAVRDSTFAVLGRLADFVPFGEPGRLASNRSGGLVLAYPAPGLWAPVSFGSEPAPEGEDLYPNVRGKMETVNGADLREVPLGIRGYAELADGTRIIHAYHYMTAPGNPPRSVSRSWLFFFDATGGFRGHLVLPVDHRWGTIAGFSGDDILIAADEPYPRVLRYRVVPTSR